MANQATHGGIFREVPIVPFPVAANIVRGMVVQWNTSQQLVTEWVDGSTPALGVATGDSDSDLGEINVFVGKGCSVQVKTAPGIVPNPNDFLFWNAPGVVSNTSDGNPAFARSIGIGFNGFVEAIII